MLGWPLASLQQQRQGGTPAALRAFPFLHSSMQSLGVVLILALVVGCQSQRIVIEEMEDIETGLLQLRVYHDQGLTGENAANIQLLHRPKTAAVESKIVEVGLYHNISGIRELSVGGSASVIDENLFPNLRYVV